MKEDKKDPKRMAITIILGDAKEARLNRLKDRLEKKKTIKPANGETEEPKEDC